MEQLPDGSVKLKLKKPIKHGSEDIGELTVREPKAKDIRTMKIPPSTDDMLTLGGKLVALPPSVIDELSIPDTMALLEVVGNFMDDGQETGSKL